MSYTTPAVSHVAKKIARIEGVEQVGIARDGAIDAIIEGGYNRPLRAHILDVGRRAMVPVRVFYRMEDGRAIGESEAHQELQAEALEDYYTPIRVAGFAGEPATDPPEEIAGDSYGTVDVAKKTNDRDSYGQLKLQRIRGNGRGRPVIGWRYGSKELRQGSKVKFKNHACLQWTMGRTMKVKSGTQAMVKSLSSRRPLVYLSIGGHEQIELPVHAIGHVYDVMSDPKMESAQYSETPMSSALSPELKRLVMTIGFGRVPGADDTAGNSAHFTGPTQPDFNGYSGIQDDAEEEVLLDKDPRSQGSAMKIKVRGDKPVDDPSSNTNAKTKTILLGMQQKMRQRKARQKQ